MTSFELTEKIKCLLDSFESNIALNKLFSQIEIADKNVQSKISELLASETQSEISQKGQETYNIIVANLNVFKDNSPKAIFAELSKFIASAQDLDTLIEDFPNGIFKQGEMAYGRFGELAISFEIAYEEFIQSYNQSTAAKLFTTGSAWKNSFRDVSKTLEAISEKLDSKQFYEDGEEALTLVLYRDFELSLFIKKLEAMNALYNHLCRLFNVSTAEFPLKIVRLEIGSLWAKIFGERQVIKLMTDLIRDGVNFLHRNYTNEGKIIAIPAKLEALKSASEMEDLLREKGIDTKQMREDIQLGGAIVTKNLNILLAAEAKIKINDETISVGEKLEQKYLEESKTLLLEAHNENGE